MSQSVEKRKRYTYQQMISMSKIQCEFDMCCFTSNKPEVFLQHVVDHGTTIQEPTAEGFMCPWRECEFLSEELNELLRHLYFHGFHAKVKAIGEIIETNLNIQCGLNRSARNVLPDIPEVFECCWDGCSMKFSSAQHFYWHTTSHAHGEQKENSLFACRWQNCDTRYKTMVKLKDHLRAHTQEKLVGCPDCGALLYSTASFESHCERQIVPGDDQIQEFKCSYCSKCFSTERILRDHVSRHIHRYKCPQCPLTAPNATRLEKHILHRHSNNRAFQCPECPKRFKTSADCTRHLYSHQDTKTFQCPLDGCTYSCKVPAKITTHLTQNHSGIPGGCYQCHRCKQNFMNGSRLTKHLKAEHNYHWPSGYVRFRYRKEEDGYYRLQTTRFESVELAAQLDQEENPSSVASEEPLLIAESPSSL